MLKCTSLNLFTRTKIGFCKHLAATSREIREDHEQLYLKRKKFERSTPVFTYPLPWQPGWRNLLRGRPLGGNRFVIRDNRYTYDAPMHIVHIASVMLP